VSDPRSRATAAAVRAAHDFFEANSGWGEPSFDALEEWLADDACQCPDECWVAPVGVCEHGLASWWLVLDAMGATPPGLAPRPLASLRSAPNFRDLGGIRTADGRSLRPGLVYRSGVLDLLDDREVSHLRALGVATVVDLRADDERAARVNRLPAGVEDRHRPVTDVSAHPQTIMERIARGDTEGLGAPMLLAGNRHFVEAQAARFGGVVRELVDPVTHAVVVHCTAGKDRTGFAVAALLWTLGVDHETVIADYLETNHRMHERQEQTLTDAAARGIDVRPLEEMMRVRRDYLEAAIDEIDVRYGSIDAFVRDGLGVDDELRVAARDRLLAP
jgi:protein-tyrosine phosphatase